MKKHFSLIFFTVFVLSLFSCTHSSEIIKYKVTYVSTYGEVQEPIEVEENTILYGEQLAELSYEHGIFLGWYNDETKVEAGTFTVTKDVTLTAKWQINTCFVTFDPGLGIGNNYVEEVDFNTPITIPQNTFSAQVGYKFAGWTKNQGEFVEFNIGDTYTVTEDVSFKAIWIEKDSYSITYHNLKDGDVITGKKTNPTSYKENQIVRLYSVERTGYIFEGWFENQDYSGNSVSGWVENTKADNIDLYPKFTPITYKIRFNPNGGSGEMEDIECTYDEEFEIPDCPYSRLTFVFKEWKVSDKTYKAKEKVMNLSDKEGDVIELTAEWKDVICPLNPKNCVIWRIEHNSIQIKYKTPTDLDLAKIRIYYKNKDNSDVGYQDFEVDTEDCNGVKIQPDTEVITEVKGENPNGLLSYTEYSFTVVAVDKAGNESTDNKIIPFTKTRIKPIDPSFSVEIKDISINLSWKYPDSEILPDSDYTETIAVIKEKETGNQVGNFSSSDKNTTSYKVDKLKPNTKYTINFEIHGFKDNSGYYGEWNYNEDKLTEPSLVTNLSFARRYPTSVQLSWKNPQYDFDKIQLSTYKLNDNGDVVGSPKIETFDYDETTFKKEQDITVFVKGLESKTKYKIIINTVLGSITSKEYVETIAETALPPGQTDIGYYVYKNTNNDMFAYYDVQSGSELELFGVVIAIDSENKPLKMINTWNKGKRDFSRCYSLYSNKTLTWHESPKFTGVEINTDFDDGEANMKTEVTVSGTTYKLFEKVGGYDGYGNDGFGFTGDDIAAGWYLPAINEFNIFADEVFASKINTILSNAGKPIMEADFYFSSTLTETTSVHVWNNKWKRIDYLHRFNNNDNVAYYRLFMNISNKSITTDYVEN